MGKRGRISAADREMQINVGVVEAEYPDPPKSLKGEEERAVWIATVRSCEEGHFKPHHYPTLEAYCGHVVRCRRLMEMIHMQEEAHTAMMECRPSPVPFMLEEYLKLLNVLQRQSNACSTLSVKMRISQQSEYDVRGVRKGHEPTEDEQPWAH